MSSTVLRGGGTGGCGGLGNAAGSCGGCAAACDPCVILSSVGTSVKVALELCDEVDERRDGTSGSVAADGSGGDVC